MVSGNVVPPQVHRHSVNGIHIRYLFFFNLRIDNNFVPSVTKLSFTSINLLCSLEVLLLASYRIVHEALTCKFSALGIGLFSEFLLLVFDN